MYTAWSLKLGPSFFSTSQNHPTHQQVMNSSVEIVHFLSCSSLHVHAEHGTLHSSSQHCKWHLYTSKLNLSHVRVAFLCASMSV